METVNNSSGACNVLSYVSGVTKALTGMELVTVAYKTGKDGKKKDSKCVNVVPVSGEEIAESIDALLPHIQGMIRTARAGILRDILDSDGNKSLLSAADFSLGAVVEYLENSSESGRMTKVSLGNWFSQGLEETLTVVIADKLGVSDSPTFEQESKVAALVASYKDKLCALAGGKTAYNKKIATSLIKAVEMVSGGIESDSVAQKLHQKLVKMRDAQDVEMIDLL
jgi:hypothetical protein